VTLDIRPGDGEDTDAVARLERDALGADAWSAGLVAEGLAGRIPTTVYLVADLAAGEPDRGVVGYAAASVVADVAELQRIAVDAGRRRTGVASGLLARVEAEALRRHADRLLLEVRVDNAAACAFYAARGFVEIDRRARYYADGTTAVVLQKELADG
jgi:ribosomal-protein-alanine N-acetyltransferase